MKNNINNKMFKVIITVFIISMICTFISFADNSDKVSYDKLREPVTEILRPTASTKGNEDSMSYILRQKVRDDDIISTSSDANMNRWVNEGVIYQSKENPPVYETEASLINIVSPRKIRHTYSVAKLEEGEYQLVTDYNTGLIKVKICTNGGFYSSGNGREINANGGEFWAQNGFYEINNKIYYFDENALMLLGPAYDERGGEYFFSYETGELLSEKH